MILGKTICAVTRRQRPAQFHDETSAGNRGESGARGIMGLRGERGEAAPTIRSWEVDRTRYLAIPVMSDGFRGPPLELRALFEQFLLETQS